MKIVHLIPSVDYGGTERLMLTLAAKQQVLGHEIHIISFTGHNGYKALSQGINIVHLPPVEVVWKWNATFSSHLDVLEATLSKLTPDIIHSHSYWTDLMIYSLPKCPGARYFSHFHLFYPFYQKLSVVNPSFIGHQFVRRRLFKAYAAYSTSFIAVSTAIQRYYKAEFPTALGKRITVIPNGVDMREFAATRPVPTTQNQLVSIGRLSTEKNYLFLLQVAGLLSASGVDFVWKVAGEGPHREELSEKIAYLQLEKNVLLMGHVEDVGQLLRESDLLVHASGRESFGLVFLEAMAAGVPSVSFAAGGNEEIVTNGVEGRLLPGHSSAREFADAIVELLANEARYESFRQKGFERVKLFSFEEYARRIMHCYSSG